jgi:2-isopropylmalate synthase
MSGDKIVVLDTTLRDGEQSPGVSFSLNEKVEIARMLEKLRVDVIEAGFAATSEGEFASITAVARAIKDCTICSLSRAVERDIDLTAESIRHAASGRIHIVLSTSPIHMKHKLCMEPDQVLEQGVRAVKYARRYSDGIEFSCEDASRSDPEFLARLVEALIAAGATTISLPDTVGYAMPTEYGGLISYLMNTVPNSDKATFSAHCHNDLGLAVGNSLAAIKAGARQVECTVNGIGERAGNASLEEIAMAIRTRQAYFGVDTRIATQYLVPASKLVSRTTGFAVQPNKAIVGKNAFTHQSGIHQDGMLKNPGTYQIMTATEVGWGQEQTTLVLGKLSGRNGFKHRMKGLGVSFDSEHELNSAFLRFKKMAEAKHSLEDSDLLSIIEKVGDSDLLSTIEKVG